MREVQRQAGPALRSVAAGHWGWVTLSVLAGALLLGMFLAVVDPHLDRQKVSGAVFAATLVLTGVLVGYRSVGRTTWEPGVGGFLLVLLAVLAVTVSAGLPPLAPVAFALVLGPLFAVAGAWTGEMLQGSYEDSSEGVQWLWVLVAIVVGFMSGVYAIFIGEALLGINYLGLVASFGASFMLTGFVVGYFSPGTTILEPAIATAGIVVLDGVLSLIHFHALFPVGALMIAIVAGVVLSVTGAWLGEAAQDLRGAAPPEPARR